MAASNDDRTVDQNDRSGVRWLVFAGVCLVAVGVSALAIMGARRDRARDADGTSSVELASTDVSAWLADDLPDLVFESTALDDAYGRLAAVPLDDPGGARAVADLACERVHVRAGRGVCLRADRGVVTTYEAVVFDGSLSEVHHVGLAGAPSRVQISPSGRLAGVTVFVTGHSYAQSGFSTQTTVLDLESGDVIGDLEVDFVVRRDGEVWREVDFNLWGVTFVDDERFYATLASGGEHYLVEGDIVGRELVVLVDGVECPSLSPDGTRIAYKARQDDGLGPVSWRIAVMDLRTMERVELAERRSVDDQVSWLDDSTVMYGLARSESPAETDTWTVPADGSGEPRLLIEGAWSTVVVAPVP